MKDIRQTSHYARYLSKLSWQVSREGGVYVFCKKLPIVGNVVKIQRPEKLNKRIIASAIKKYKPFKFYVEPEKISDGRWLIVNGFRLSKNSYLPTQTLQVDLTESVEKLLSQMKKDCRLAIYKSSKVPVQTISDLACFHRYWKKAVGFRRWVPSLIQLEALKSSFPSSTLFLASHNGEAGAIFIRAGKIAYYWQAFTSKLGRKSFHQYQIVWQAILWAKKSGAKIFDFEGIYDPRFPLPSWKGFTHFKKSFGACEVKYPGCFVKTSFRSIIRL